jgi:hypothetical protein
MQFLGLVSVASLIGVAGVGAASTLRKQSEVTASSEGNITPPEIREKKVATKPAVPAAAPVVQQAAKQVAAVVDSTPAPVVSAPLARPASRGGFVLVEGKTQLTDSVYALRTGDSVIVNFDAFGYRTRRSDKFEHSLHETLPLLFGKMATANLDTLKKGDLVTNHDVVHSLANDGMQITLGNGATVRIRALTRAVSDGPIAIGYLATIER